MRVVTVKYARIGCNSAMYGRNPPDTGMPDTFNGPRPQFHVGIYRIFYENWNVRTFQGIGYFLDQKRVRDRARPYPNEIKPGSEYEEEGEERDGYFFAEKRLSWKTYRFAVLAPEYLCDVMRFIPLADHVRITDKYGREYLCDTFGTEVDWQEQGDLAAVSAEFTTDTAVKKIPTCGSAATGDFNADFSTDFNTGI